ncbi:uncharacterized protein LOC144666215 [Oculina patagonica]
MERPVLYSSAEKTNGAKLSRLLIDGGTEVLRKLFNSYHSPTNLVAALNSNYFTLNNLLKKKVLHKTQWDQLFPPGGGVPDSKTFDITLLFVLLANICGLSPPALGWHTKPPPGDNSLEANLARIKSFRNELHGHVTTTGLDTATFTALWKEISAVLVDLGHDLAEIDRLEAECCGEEEYLNVLFEWGDREEEIRSQMKEVTEAQIKTLKVVEDVRQLLKTTVCKKLKGTVEDNDSDEILKNLAKSEFKGDIEFHAGRFQVSTREWVFKEVEEWLDDRNCQNRVMVISGNAGMGKSVISAIICKRMREAGRLSGSHFCQHNNVRYRNPQLMLQSLACHLCHALPEYKNALVEQLSRNVGAELDNLGVEELFALLFKEPMDIVADPGRNTLIVIDGLDESEYQGRNELLDVIANHFCKLPRWIRFLVTTRPERNITESLKRLEPFQLEPNADKNLEDIELFFKNQLHFVLNRDVTDACLKNLVEKSEGLMLYAYFLVEFIQKNVSLLDQRKLDDSLPLGISSVYHSYFKRLEAELYKEVGIKEENFLVFLCAVTACREPLPLSFILNILGLGTKAKSEQRKANKAISCVSALLPIRDGRLHIIHKSVKDWLTDKSCYGDHDFSVDEEEGHSILASLSSNVLDDVKQKGVHDSQFSDTEKYALQHGVQHMLALREESRPCDLEEAVKKYVVDLELVYAKLCVSNTYNTVASEDVLNVQMHEISKALSGDLQKALSSLLFLLRKHRNTLRNLPRVFFQLALNEGGPELSLKASNALETRYSEIPYMECLDDEPPQGGTSVELHCSDTVACFDVSPQLDLMVCECHDETIQLWSLQTSKLEWVRPVIFKKDYSGVPFGSAYKIPPSSQNDNLDPSLRPLSCYRSVVFHPNGDLVLPGSLSRVYTIGGDQQRLFPSSSCEFTVCQFSGDSSMMLTDCLDETECVIIWSLATGKEIARLTRNEPVLAFTCSRDGTLLAISHQRSICLFEVGYGFRCLGEKVIPLACGLINFSPNNQVLACLHLTELSKHPFRFKVSLEDSSNMSQKAVLEEIDQDISNDSCPWEFEHRTKGGFLLGDPIDISSEKLSSVVPFWEAGFISVLNKETALMSSPDLNYLSRINLRKLNKSREDSETVVQDVAFSIDGETLYVVSNNELETTQTTVTAWDVSNTKIRGQLQLRLISLMPVKDGVVLVAQNKSPELWNFKLSRYVRRWSMLNGITKTIPISEELVACVGRQGDVSILATTGKETILSTIQPFEQRYVVACNSKYQLITVGQKHHFRPNVKDSLLKGTLRLSSMTSLIWERDLSQPWCEGYKDLPHCIFSPKDDFVVVWGNPLLDSPGVHILDAISGDTHHTLPNSNNVVDCKFVSDEECLVYNRGINVLRLFNVKSGDLLSVMDIEERPCCLAVCLPHHLIAICLSSDRFRLIRVWSPQTKDRRKNKRVKQSNEQHEGWLSQLLDMIILG